MKELYSVIGYPIGHSLSPHMQNAVLNHHSIDGYYHAFEIAPEKVEEGIKGLKALNIKGFNVTIPYKVKVMDFLDEIDELAREIGAVNTVVNENGRYVGYNTDGDGYLQSLLTFLERPSLQDQSVLILGAGGAARALLFTIAAKGQANCIDIANRTLSKAQELITSCPIDNEGTVLSITEAEENLGRYDIIINTTAVGMSPNVEESPLSLQHVKKGATVSDIIYNPLETKLLREAKERGALAHTGIGMFVMQGALAFEKWTGVQPDVKVMEDVVLRHLQKK
ncbi:shikimate dehydrogenase [Priestia endophytica]|uniref:shikimate dehydrogenase n=1 Tax=Priestia endophytica TaxID=135735 RepID=UPI000DCA5543|nr:shikimate dehydrogenase [Priestia endophytica]RAS92767.1 shikimate dehydrogenase [Priestia endophytica]